MKTDKKLTTLVIPIAVVSLAIIIGVVALLRIDPSGERGSGLPPSCDYNLDKYETITPAMVHYRQKAVIPVAMKEVRGVAIGAEDRILVAGDKALHVFDSNGKKLKEMVLEQEPYCLAVGNAEQAFPGRLYLGMRDHVEVYDGQGNRRAVWSPPAQRRADLDRPIGGERVCRRCRFVGRLALRSDRQSGRTDRPARPVAGNSPD